MKAPLSRLFDPKSIAIVGASTSPEKPGYQMVKAFEKFPGKIYPVNPRGGDVLGFDMYTSLSDIPEPVDLIAMVVPPQASADVLREAAACGAGAAFMVSGGFSETGWRRPQTTGRDSRYMQQGRHPASRPQYVGVHAPVEETVLHFPARCRGTKTRQNRYRRSVRRHQHHARISCKRTAPRHQPFRGYRQRRRCQRCRRD